MLRDLRLPEGIKRLQRLEQLLEAQADKLEAENIVSIWHKGKEVKFDLGVWARENICGYTACACGLMGMTREANEEGFHLACGVVPAYQGDLGMDAVMLYFEIEEEQAVHLFAPRAYPFGERKGPAGARAVAKRIRELVAEKVSVL